MELAVNTHVRYSTIFSCEFDLASRFVVSAQPRRYSSNGKHDILLGQNRTPDFGALRLGNTNVIRIGADRFWHFFVLGKSVGEFLSPLVGNELHWVFGDWIPSARDRTCSGKFLSPVGEFYCALHLRLVFPIYWSPNGI